MNKCSDILNADGRQNNSESLKSKKPVYDGKILIKG